MFKFVVSRLVGWEPHGRFAWMIAIKVLLFRLLLATGWALVWGSGMPWYLIIPLTLAGVVAWIRERDAHLALLERIQ